MTPITNSKGTAFFSSSGTTTVLGSATFDGFVSYFANKRHAVRRQAGGSLPMNRAFSPVEIENERWSVN